MTLYVEELNLSEFIEYSMQRMLKANNNYSHVTKGRLKMIFDFYSKWKMKSEGNRLKTTINGEWNSELTIPDPTVDNYQAHKVNLFHNLFCETERCGHLCDKWIDSDGLAIVADKYGNKWAKAFKEV